VTRIVRGSTGFVRSPLFVDASGDPVDLDDPPTVTVTRSDGTVLAAPSVDAAQHGVWTATFTATGHTDELDVLDVVWAGEASGVELTHRQQVAVVDRRLIAPAALRQMRSLESSDKWPVWLLDDAVEHLEDLVEDWCQVSFVRRVAVHRMVQRDGSVSRVIVGHRPVRAIKWLTVDGDAEDVADWVADESGVLVPVAGAPSGRVIDVAVEYGYDQPPQDLVTEGARWCREKILHVEVTSPSQAISETQDGRTIRYSTPDPRMGRPTGSLDLDAVLKRVAERVPGVA
jgi:hypothetical protein